MAKWSVGISWLGLYKVPMASQSNCGKVVEFSVAHGKASVQNPFPLGLVTNSTWHLFPTLMLLTDSPAQVGGLVAPQPRSHAEPFLFLVCSQSRSPLSSVLIKQHFRVQNMLLPDLNALIRLCTYICVLRSVRCIHLSLCIQCPSRPLTSAHSTYVYKYEFRGLLVIKQIQYMVYK